MVDIECEVYVFSKPYICENFSEHKCMVCQLNSEYNKVLSLIVNNLSICIINVDNKNTVEFKFKPGLSESQKHYINNKLIRLNGILDLLSELD